MNAPIGYYVHHQGEGHRHRARAIASAIPGRFTLIGTGLSEDSQIDLPDDRIERAFHGLDGATERPKALHYAPFDHDGLRQRVGRIANWIAEKRPALLVVDVSVEVAMLARLTSTPVAYVRLAGVRNDWPHQEAFRGASILVSPFHRDLEAPETPDWVRRKTLYCPGLTAQPAVDVASDDIVLVVVGRGGETLSYAQIASAACATPDRRWRVAGLTNPSGEGPPNLELLGWVGDMASEIARAGVVVGAAGDGLVSAVIAARRPFICIPEPRAFDEQVSKAQALSALGAAIVCSTWPRPDQWPARLRMAEAMDCSVLARLDVAYGPLRAAEQIIDVADAARVSTKRSRHAGA